MDSISGEHGSVVGGIKMCYNILGQRKQEKVRLKLNMFDAGFCQSSLSLLVIIFVYPVCVTNS